MEKDVSTDYENGRQLSGLDVGTREVSDSAMLRPKTTNSGSPVCETGAVLRTRKTRTLVMWSGGIDSTYALWHVLTQCDDEVYAHHVSVHKGAAHGQPARPSDTTQMPLQSAFEAAAVNCLRTPLAKCTRAFGFSQSSIDLSAFGQYSEPNIVLMFMAAQAGLSLALTPFDRVVFGVSQSAARQWQPDTIAFAWHRTRLMRMLRAAWGAEEVPFLYLQNPRPDKRAAIGAIGPSLFALTVSCESPMTNEDRADTAKIKPRDALRACGGCEKCRLRAACSTDLTKRGRPLDALLAARAAQVERLKSNSQPVAD